MSATHTLLIGQRNAYMTCMGSAIYGLQLTTGIVWRAGEPYWCRVCGDPFSCVEALLQARRTSCPLQPYCRAVRTACRTYGLESG